MTSRERILARLRELGPFRQRAKVRVGGFVEWWTVGPNGEKINPEQFKNGAATVGLNKILDVMFRSVSPITAWYAGLINNAGFSGVAAADTMASHGGWTEWTSYSGTDRATWSPDAAASGVLVNSTPFTFAISANGTLAGAFITSVQSNTPGNTGTLWATALSTRAVSNGDTLSGIYGITLTPTS